MIKTTFFAYTFLLLFFSNTKVQDDLSVWHTDRIKVEKMDHVWKENNSDGKLLNTKKYINREVQVKF